VSEGHNYADVINYPLPRLVGFTRLAIKRKNEDRKFLALATRMGGADNDDFKNFYKELGK
jgi:hypothetical protein